MGSNRSYDFVTGFETSTAPTATTPSSDSDIINKGYADDTYAKLQYWGDAVADVTALKAIGSSDRFDKQTRLVESLGNLWAFDSSSSATEDGTTIIQPTSGTGRWLVTSSSGGGGSGSGSALESLQTQNALASIGYSTPKMDNSIRVNGLEIPAHKYSTSYLIENYTSGGSTMKMVHNAKVIYDSDKDYDSITNWAAVGAGATLAATAGTTKVGANHFSFDKNGTAVDASIRHTLAAQTLSVGGNYRVWFWVSLPSITNLSNVYLKIMGAATTDFSRWNLTTDYSGAALATGYNLMFVDIANTAASTTGGTAWTTSQLARYVEVGVTTSSAGQTYTGIKFAGLWFSEGDITAFGNKYLKYTVYDTSVNGSIIIDSTNTRYDGPVTLAGSGVAQNFTAGIAAAASARIVRSALSWSQAGLIGFDTALTSGTIVTSASARQTILMRESLSGNWSAYTDLSTQQMYKVTEITSGTVFKVAGSDDSLNLLSGDSLHCFTSTPSDGEQNFTLLATKALTANSSYSSNVITLTVADTTGMAVGDWVVKKHLDVSASVVSATANENMSAMSLSTAPNGVQLIGSRPYPNANYVYAHWLLGAANDTLALKDQTGNNRGLTKAGSVNLSDSFKSGKYGASNFAAANYLRTAGATVSQYDGNAELIQYSFWMYFDGTNASTRVILAPYDGNGTGSGFLFRINSSTSVCVLEHYNGGSGTVLTHGSTLTIGAWHHIVIQSQSSTHQRVYVNGVATSVTAGAITTTQGTQAVYLGGYNPNTGTLDTSLTQPMNSAMKLADMIVYRDGPVLTQADVNYLYNNSVPQSFGYGPSILRSEYEITGQSGRRLSIENTLTRSTSAVSPYILQSGIIKTG